MKKYILAIIAALLMVPAPLMAAKPDQFVIIEGRRTGKEAAYRMDSIYYLPFDVPAGVAKITIEKEINIEPEGRVGLSTAVFDSRGKEFQTEGYRGWQEFRTDPIVISGDRATTTRKFSAGPIPAGRWYIAQHYTWLGAKVTGVRYKYKIAFSFDGPQPPSKMPMPDYNPGILKAQPGWYKADLHNHTFFSDGRESLEEMVGNHVAEGYDVVVSTDHNVAQAHFDFADVARKYPNCLLLGGEEVSTLTGHANVIGSKPGEWFDIRMVPGDGRLPRLIDYVHSRSALFSINHPAGKAPLGWGFAPDEWAKADAIEVWNGAWTAGDIWALGHIWDPMLKNGQHIVAMAGSDYHGKPKGAIGPCTWIWAENLSRDAIIDGMRKGHVFISRGTEGPQTYLSVQGQAALPGDTINIGNEDTIPVQIRMINGPERTLHLVWQNGDAKIPIERGMQTIRYSVPVDRSLAKSYIRAEVLKSDGSVEGITNPIYIERAVK